MKRLLLFILLAAGYWSAASAQLTALVIQKADGTKVTFALSERPTIYFQGSTIVIKTATQEVEFSPNMKFDLNFSESTNGIEQVIARHRPQLEGDCLVLSGEQPQSAVTVYDTAGRLCLQTQTDGDGNAAIALDTLPKGIYMIKTKTSTHKIIKK